MSPRPSQFVFVEIKKDTTTLLRTGDPYRAGCRGVSSELSNAVTQVQKTAFEFTQQGYRVALNDCNGDDTGHMVYSIERRCFLIVDDTKELRGNEDKVACFELYRRNIRMPEILTFDELYTVYGSAFTLLAAMQ